MWVAKLLKEGEVNSCLKKETRKERSKERNSDLVEKEIVIVQHFLACLRNSSRQNSS